MCQLIHGVNLPEFTEVWSHESFDMYDGSNIFGSGGPEMWQSTGTAVVRQNRR